MKKMLQIGEKSRIFIHSLIQQIYVEQLYMLSIVPGPGDTGKEQNQNLCPHGVYLHLREEEIP